MEKLDKKGFTLVELLAVIIILAIVVGISIPAVMTTVNNAKTSAGNSAAKAAADWVDRQYQAAKSGFDISGGSVTVDSNFTATCGATGSKCEGGPPVQMNINADTKTTITHFAGSSPRTETITVSKAIAQGFIQATGLLTTNVIQMDVKINENGRSCVKIIVPRNSDYFNTEIGGTATSITYSGGLC